MASDVAAVLKDIDRLAEDTRASVILVHHFSKRNQAGKESGDRASGSGVWFRDMDVYISMTKQKAPGEYTMEITARNAPPIDHLAVKWDFPCWVRDLNPEVDPQDLYNSAKWKLGEKRWYPSHILAVLPEEGATSSEWKKLALQFNVGMSDREFYRLLQELKKADPPVVRSEGKGKGMKYYPVNA